MNHDDYEFSPRDGNRVQTMQQNVSEQLRALSTEFHVIIDGYKTAPDRRMVSFRVLRPMLRVIDIVIVVLPEGVLINIFDEELFIAMEDMQNGERKLEDHFNQVGWNKVASFFHGVQVKRSIIRQMLYIIVTVLHA